METIIQQLVSGIANGSLYSILAVGIVLILKTTGVANFAQGEIGMIGTFIAFTFITSFGMNIFAAIFLAMLASGLIGFLLYKSILTRFENDNHLNTAIVTLGLFYVFNSFVGIFWDHNTRKFPSLFSESTIHIKNIVISAHHIGIIVTTLIIAILLSLYFNKTKIGIATIAVSQNAYAAKLMGVNIGRIYMYTWIIGAVLAVLAGVMLAPVVYLDGYMMADLLIKAFVAAVLGGLFSIPGAFLGGLTLGLFESLATTFVSGEMKDTLSFLLVILVLMFKPEGMLGKVYEEKV